MGFFDRFRYKDPVEKLIHEVVNDFKVERLLCESDLCAAFNCMYHRYKNESTRNKIIDKLNDRCKSGELIGLWHICTDFACVEFADQIRSSFEIMQATAHDLQKKDIATSILDGKVYSMSEFKSALESAKKMQINRS